MKDKDLIKKIQSLDNANEIAIYVETSGLQREQIVRYIEKLKRIIEENFPDKKYIFLPHDGTGFLLLLISKPTF